MLLNTVPIQFLYVVEKTEAETVMMELAERIFSQNTEEAEDFEETGADMVLATESNSLSSKDKVGFSVHSKKQNKKNCKI